MNEREKVHLLGLVLRKALTVASLGCMVLLFSAPSGAQSTPEKSTPSTAKVVAQPSEKPSPVKAAQSHANGKTEEINVHGHWTIEVRNPDGTVVTHREVENSLLGNGAQFLGAILGRHNTVGAWQLSLESSTVQPCVISGPTQCIIAEPTSGIAVDSHVFLTLNVSVGAAGTLVLSGTAVAGENGTIDSVHSSDLVCSNTVSPSACAGPTEDTSFQFTSADVNPAVNVSTGQTVAVTVTFTFS